MSSRAVARTALLLAGGQTVVYIVQENLESAAAGAGWPGLWVVLPPQHSTVILLHLVVAVSGSVLLWTLASLLTRSDQVIRLIAALVRLLMWAEETPPRLVPTISHRPNLRLVAGVLGLRSPPLAA
jgi:hypothetical protein